MSKEIEKEKARWLENRQATSIFEAKNSHLSTTKCELAGTTRSVEGKRLQSKGVIWK